MKTKKMTLQVKAMVKEVNEELKFKHIKNTDNELFNTMCWLLMRAGCYNGFNYYTIDGKLSGGDNESFDHLEIYIK